MTKKKKKSVVLYLVALALALYLGFGDTDALLDVLDDIDLIERPQGSPSEDYGDPYLPDLNATEQTMPTSDRKDTVLAAVPEELRDNYFLGYKEIGCCKTLTGDVAVTVVMISDSVSSWDEASVQKLKQSLDTYAQDIVTEAAAYSKELSFTFQYYHSAMEGDICSGAYSNDWQNPALTGAGLPELSAMHSYVIEQQQAKEAPVVFAFNKNGRAYASVGPNEFLVLFSDSDFSSFQHELSHIFGAKDFYYPKEVTDLATELLDGSIMNSGETADPLTAYLIGWADAPDDSAVRFLQDTIHITKEYMDAQHEIESFTGYGTKEFSYGIYTGDMIRGRCHGTGTMQYFNGGWYTGSWDNGKWSGDGTGKQVYDNGVYEGTFLDGKRHGQGVYTWADGKVYSGAWVNGERSGIGTLTYPDGGWYTGSFAESKKSGVGSGKEIYDNGYYEGAFLDGERHGQGIYAWNDGTVYNGAWVNGERTGTGTISYPDGGWYTGGFENGKKSGVGSGKEIYSNGYYEGAFQDGERHGQGTYYWSEGDRFTGQWVDGQRTGYGTYIWADGSTKSGTWKDGKFVE